MQPIACEVCGRRVAVRSAAVCASCGAAVEGERPIEDYTTRPAAEAPVAVAARAVSDTDTRTAVPPVYDTTHTLPADPGFAPAASLSGPLDASTRPVTDEALAPSQSSASRRLGGRMPIARIASLVALVVVLLGVATGIALAGMGKLGLGAAHPTSTPTATATPAPPAGFERYTDTAAGYALFIPQSWRHDSHPGTGVAHTVFYDDATTLLDVWTINGEAALTGAALDDTYLGIYGGDVTKKQGPAPVTVGGATWTRESAEGTRTDSGVSTAVRLVALSTVYQPPSGAADAKRTYIIVYSAPAPNFVGADSAYFQQMLDSFTFQR